MARRRIHLIAPAAPCGPFLRTMKLESPQALIELVRQIVGPDYVISGNAALLDAEEHDRAGGRTDDRERAEDIESALADSTVVALIALRGGAWFTRILPHIDFSVLDRRSTRVAVFGFSEITPLCNIVGAHRNGLGIYYMGPAFLPYGLRRYAATQRGLANGSHQAASLAGPLPHGRGTDRGSAEASPSPLSSGTEPATPEAWMQARLRDEFRAYFVEVISILEGRRENIVLEARLVDGEMGATTATFTGGNLTVLSPLIGSSFAQAIDPRGRWLLLEDFNDKPERFDRFLSHLTLAGFWNRCAGLLLGDFHNDKRDLFDEVRALLKHHLPQPRNIPVLAAPLVGHTWPMTPLPVHVAASVDRDRGDQYIIRWPGPVLKVV